ncbi:uncharacterized skeletal organic matrix protein 5-like isoform X2 [Stylophora pistillata]|uniref:EGF-like domain-containing protein n=1 Tax=Stylophora pistillata TaxID=50429 RepID=A0A2B4SWS4_STYPI|nr:uncharacterized skeletal organic matrix protein 5-like isoform X2 [Stylophora pistillata]XP_022797630.1 uncharacterized skeletal organic matrix protein 5-like isoform X2 [Stylophora pistillata]PFX33639.1 hypothetical protein AWC38_SpisGene1533 [Stylophora pistillata]
MRGVFTGVEALFVSFALLREVAPSQESNIKSYHRGISSTTQTLRLHEFIKYEFRYLKVPQVRATEVSDAFDCAFECLSNLLCFSVNLAASKGAHGKLWCELLSSDRHRNSTEYKRNESSHHFAIKSPCSSSPCQSEALCVANYNDGSFECLCKEGYKGEYCQKENAEPESCKEAFNLYRSDSSHLVILDIDSQKTTVLCHMGDFGCGDGGWTPVMKIDGNKRTFHYDSAYWSNKNEYNPLAGKTGFDSQETKLPTYWNTSFSKICLGMKVDNLTNFIVVNKQGDSLYSLIADGQYRATSLGRDKWKTLIGSEASLQPNCNKEGLNAVGASSVHSKARIGITTNEQDDCSSCDTRLGLGTGGFSDDTNTCGNVASHSPDNGVKIIKTMGYILVQ